MYFNIEDQKEEASVSEVRVTVRNKRLVLRQRVEPRAAIGEKVANHERDRHVSCRGVGGIGGDAGKRGRK